MRLVPLVIVLLRTLPFVALFFVSASVAGCAPSCRDACRHMLEDCGIERADWGLEDCTVGCERYLAHYEDDWQKTESRDAVRCIRNSSCDELQGGTPCYDEAVYVW